jgi:hypothetical protein
MSLFSMAKKALPMAKHQGDLNDIRLSLIEAKLNEIMHNMGLDAKRKEFDDYYFPKMAKLKADMEKLLPEAELQKMLDKESGEEE